MCGINVEAEGNEWEDEKPGDEKEGADGKGKGKGKAKEGEGKGKGKGVPLPGPRRGGFSQS